MKKKREMPAKEKTAPKAGKSSPPRNGAKAKEGARKKTEQMRISRDIMALVACMLAAVLIGLSVRAFGFGLVLVRSEGMADTLLPGDIVLVSRTAQPEAGNIVLAGALNGSVLRRVAGEPGDAVAAARGKVLRNGMELYEPYATGEMEWTIPGRVLEEEVYLLLPDNRAFESALVRRGGISGVVRAVVWPPSRAGFF